MSSVRLRRVLTSRTTIWLDSTLDWSSGEDVGLASQQLGLLFKGGIVLFSLRDYQRCFFVELVFRDVSDGLVHLHLLPLVPGLPPLPSPAGPPTFSPEPRWSQVWTQSLPVKVTFVFGREVTPLFLLPVRHSPLIFVWCWMTRALCISASTSVMLSRASKSD